MYTEKIIKPPSGYLTLSLFLVLLIGGIYTLTIKEFLIGSVILVINFILVLPGLIIVNPK